MTTGCLEESTVLAFLDGTLPRAERGAVEAHVSACSACADLVTWAAADQASSTTRLPGHEGRPFVGQLHPGARVDRYQVLGAVGRGGMGEVYAAYHPDLDRRIALKVVQGSSGGRDSGERRVRLLREARAIARLSHPNVVTVHDAGTFGDRVFIAMEFVDGTTVDGWLQASPRTWREILDVFIAAGRGLAEAHVADIIHRDFKPQNVMIAKNGAVRVMDFGLARMNEADATDARARTEDESTVSLGPVTKTGAFVGTPAYMSPEQFRREQTDARSDQFSFCVALHEALYGIRPAPATSEGSGPMPVAELPSARGGVPGWLRGVVLRGASAEKAKRFPSMDALLAALDRGRTRSRRRAASIAVGLAVLLVAGGGWRIARGNKFACAVPEDRVAGAWSSDAADPRRQSIHRAFATSGRATAETSWERVSRVLDDYMQRWRAMYLQTCEATHVRREQSAEVLDLRMACLNDNLDQVSALTNALVTADDEVVSRAVAATTDLTPVARCADLALLKSAVPLPKDERTLREVRRLRRELAEVEATREVGKVSKALAKALALRPQVERTGYKPLLGELFETVGTVQADAYSSDATKTLEDAVFTAESAGDDPTAARAATMLIATVGSHLGEYGESERWFRLANAILDRLGTKETRTRAWALNNWASILAAGSQLEDARQLMERAVALKEHSVGPDHPDVAISLDGLGWILIELGRPREAIERLDRAISIYLRHSDPGSPSLGSALSNKGEALRSLGHYSEARLSFERALEILRGAGDSGPFLAGALLGLGETELAQRQAVAAVPPLERSVDIYGNYRGLGTLIADAQFALARALWDSGGNRQRARHLAHAARTTFASFNRREKARACADWLSTHGS